MSYEVGTLIFLFLINSGILATSTIMEESRDSQVLAFETWEPFLWEVSSAVSTLFVFPIIIMMLKRFPISWNNIFRTVFIIIIGSIIFSVLHATLMVFIRKIVYWMMNSHYDFGDLWFELLYEYRKDLWSFISFIILIEGYNFILSRLQGEANPIGNSEDDNVKQQFERLLVKKLGKEFLISIKDVEWLEASGNYVNLYIKGRVYPMRTTLTRLIEQINHQGFCRIHRSFAVNIICIESIEPTGSGDSEITLNNGKKLNLSRRYKEALKLTI